MPNNRNRIQWFFLIVITIGIGLFSRSRFIPECIYPYLGDVLYAVMYYFIFGFLFPEMKSGKVLLLSILTCYAIELLQLYQADWIEQLRRYKIGGLILGFGFLWSDMVAYTIGGGMGWLVEKYVILKRK